MREENLYINELKKCLRQPVTVIDTDDKEWKGICMAVNFAYLNVVLMTEEKKIILKNVKSITRTRKKEVVLS